MKNTLAVFENYKIRRIYDEKQEKWHFSVVDIIQALIQQPNYQAARNYWKVLKNRLKKDGSESVTKCNRLKLEAVDGKKYLTDVASPETLLRIIQSVPSPKAEPIKLWLANELGIGIDDGVHIVHRWQSEGAGSISTVF